MYDSTFYVLYNIISYKNIHVYTFLNLSGELLKSTFCVGVTISIIVLKYKWVLIKSCIILINYLMATIKFDFNLIINDRTNTVMFYLFSKS